VLGVFGGVLFYLIFVLLLFGTYNLRWNNSDIYGALVRVQNIFFLIPRKELLVFIFW
jgi:hypothetical protein